MTRELKGFLAKFDITYHNLAKELDVSTGTICNKMKNDSFTQCDINKLLKYFARYDNSVTSSIFFD